MTTNLEFLRTAGDDEISAFCDQLVAVATADANARAQEAADHMKSLERENKALNAAFRVAEEAMLGIANSDVDDPYWWRKKAEEALAAMRKAAKKARK